MKAGSKMSEGEKQVRYGNVVATFQSESNPAKSYEVRQLPNHSPTCQCRGFCIHGHCWHTDSVISHQQKKAA
jgi:hypothetical protein